MIVFEGWDSHDPRAVLRVNRDCRCAVGLGCRWWRLQDQAIWWLALCVVNLCFLIPESCLHVSCVSVLLAGAGRSCLQNFLCHCASRRNESSHADPKPHHSGSEDYNLVNGCQSHCECSMVLCRAHVPPDCQVSFYLVSEMSTTRRRCTYLS
jgi:hypothetical protein